MAVACAALVCMTTRRRRSGVCLLHSLRLPSLQSVHLTNDDKTTMSNLQRKVFHAPEAIVHMYRRAPASFLTFASLALTYVVTRALDDYRLYKLIGPGGLGRPSPLTWLVHTLVFRPLSMPGWAAQDPKCLPFDDDEWQQRVRESGDDTLSALPKREGSKPLMFGIIPHRQLEHTSPVDSDAQKAIIEHLHSLAQRFPHDLVIALSTYEATLSPSLFVRHDPNTDDASPTPMARLYLSSTPSPLRTLRDSSEDAPTLPFEPTLHELAHIHLSDGSLHLTLAPQDARQVLLQGWGERHRLAGVAYRGNWWPPYWCPTWLVRWWSGSEQHARWGYQRRSLLRNHDEADAATTRARLVPPTYTSIYAPTTDEQVRWTKRIIDASVAWAIGHSIV